jgi:hypothetical protein
VAVFSPLTGQTTTVLSGGNLVIIGAAGSSPTTGVGVIIGGPSNAGAVSVTSSKAITLSGTGGAGNVTGSTVPNAGVAIFDPGNDTGTISMAANGGNLSITGASGGGSNSTGVDGTPYFNAVDGSPSTDPSLTASGSLLILSTSGLVDTSGMAGEITALNTSVTAPVGTNSTVATQSSAGPLTLNGGNFTVTGYAGSVSLATSNVGSLTLTNGNGALAINGVITAGGLVNIQDTAGDITFGPGGSISVSGAGNNVILAAGTDLANSHYIINNSTVGGNSANAIQDSNGNFYLYSSDPTGDIFGGISVLPANLVYNATYATTGLPAVDEELFYVASAGDIGPSPPVGSSSPPPSTTTGGAGGGGSTIVPPAFVPQPTPPLTPPPGSGTLGNAPPPPPISFAGAGTVGSTGDQNGGLADSSGNSGQVGSGDAAQLGGGQLNNVANPQAAGALNQALSPVVYHSLADALAALGDWAGADNSGPGGDNAGGGQETILSGGDVVEIGDNGVKSIPANQAPPQLRNAMSGDVLNGMPAGAGH